MIDDLLDEAIGLSLDRAPRRPDSQLTERGKNPLSPGLLQPIAASSLLGILVATGEKTIEAFQATANPVDEDLLAELERIIERSREELVFLTRKKLQSDQRS